MVRCKPLINGSQGFDSVEIIRTAIRTSLTANMWNDQFFTPNWRFSFTQLPQGARLHPGPLFPPFRLGVPFFLSYFTKLRVHRDSSLNMENPKDNNHLEHLAVALQDYKIQIPILQQIQDISTRQYHASWILLDIFQRKAKRHKDRCLPLPQAPSRK